MLSYRRRNSKPKLTRSLFLLKVTSSPCEREQMSSTSSMQGRRCETVPARTTKMVLLILKQLFPISTGHVDGHPAPAVSQRSLTWLSPAWRRTSSGQPTCPWSSLADSLSAFSVFSLNSPLFFWLIQDHGCCTFHLPDWLLWFSWAAPPDCVKVSGSSLPLWLIWWHLTPLPGYHHPRVSAISPFVTYRKPILNHHI